jgi:hypothetical protein
MFDRIRNGWGLMKASGQALAADRELLVFPLVSGLATVVVAASFVVPIVMTGAYERVEGGGLSERAAGIGVLWLFYFVLATVTTYFNTALVGAAMIRLDGGDPTLGDGIAVANSRLRTIFGYAAIAASVGLIIKLLSRRGGIIQRWVMSFIGVGWSLATYLVVPVLAARSIGPIDAVRESARLFKRTWGEQVAGAGGIKLIAGLAMFLLLLLGVPAVVFAAIEGTPVVAGIVAGALVLALLCLGLVSAALQGVYSAALYRYATAGQPSFGFAPELLQRAFQRRGAPAGVPPAT